MFPAQSFSDIPQVDWGFNIEMIFYGGATTVKAHKHLSHDIYVRGFNYEGTWFTDHWLINTTSEHITERTDYTETQDPHYCVNARQLNPSIEGTLRYDINWLKNQVQLLGGGT